MDRMLLRWYDANRRDLPWRRRRSAYRTLVSELMLQQTTVATVVPRFIEFVARFPDVQALARARQDEVLACWSGLGYYARARNLHAAAREIVERHRGRVPSTEQALRGLPGVGDYTAAAVASIAFGKPTFALDGNAARVMARLHAVPGAVAAPATRQKLRALGQAMMPASRAGDFMQAVMELGALICVAGQPRCGDCPLATTCAARALGRELTIPGRTVKPERRRVLLVCALVERRGRVFLVRRASGQLLAGTWALPSLSVGDLSERHATAIRAAREAGLRAVSARSVGRIRHLFTHRDVEADVFRVEAPGAVAPADARAGHTWASLADLDHLGISTFARKTLAAGGWLRTSAR